MARKDPSRRLVVGISGASGAVYGVRLLELLRETSFKTLGMVVAPCSMRSLAEIATGATTTLLTRAADVALKERRRLVLVVRETPLHLGHLRTMAQVTEMGAIVMPPVPAFYTKPSSVDD